MIDIFKEFIKNNPSKVLGTIKETTDRFGNPDITIQGELSNLEAIEVAPINIPSKNKELSNVEVASNSPTAELNNIEESIRLTGDSNEHPKEKKTVVRKQKKKRTDLMIPGDSTQELYTPEEAFQILSKHLSKDIVSIWSWYNRSKGLPQSEFFNKHYPKETSEAWFNEMLSINALCIDPISRSYIPASIYYAGNIYDRILELTNNENYFIQINQEAQFTKQHKSLKNILPTPLKLTGDVDQRLVISVMSRFAREFEFEYEDRTISLKTAISHYIESLSSNDLLLDVSPKQIVRYYIDGDKMPRYIDQHDQVRIKRNAAQECVRLMAIFLEKEISAKTRAEIELKWNRENNGYVDVDYNQIPLAFSFSKYFKDGDLSVRPAQREGVAFRYANQTGIIAYDVGVGKTLTAILDVANALENGQCKRPLIVVPKPTYNKWISEINGIYDDNGNLIGSGILPQYNIFDISNLGVDVEKIIFKDGKLTNIPEKTITICTYEGLKNIGFSDELGIEFISELKDVLNQGFGDSTEREKALADEKINKIVGIGQEGTILNIDEAGFDYLVIDEAHNFNKIFDNVKGEVKEDKQGRYKKNYQIQGTPSDRGIKAFFISNYIQRKTNGNICLLTATPFTNSPLEVFNMLALTNIKKLNSLGLKSIVSFFDNYVNQTYESVLKNDGKFKEDAVIKGWNNKVALQKILFSYMNYKSGEDANIKRPQKWTLPRLSETVNGVVIPLSPEDRVPTFLKPTAEQKRVQSEISEWLKEQLRDSEAQKKAPHLVADTKHKKNAVSPYVYKGTPPNSISSKDFVLSSPKIQYTMDCVESVKKWHENDGSPVSGQIIYINGAIDYLSLIKDYLIDHLGYKRKVAPINKNKWYDEVEILSGSGVNSRSNDEKEEIKNLYNSGTIKVIIGTSTIREGIDLQMKTSVIYSLWPDWNPTDHKQLEGRGWRFGNMFSNIRIVMPLLAGGSDPFVFQKLEEKTGRINDIFDRNDKKNVLDIGEEDMSAIKYSLIDDLREVARMKMEDELKDLRKQKSVLNDSLEEVKSIEYKMRNLRGYNNSLDDFLNNFHPILVKSIPNYEVIRYETDDEDAPTNLKIREFKFLQKHMQFVVDHFENKSTELLFQQQLRNYSYDVKSLQRTEKELDKIDTRMIAKYGESIFDSLEEVQKKISDEIEQLSEKIFEIDSEETIDRLTAELEAERDKFNAGIDTYENTINQFKKLNYLLGITDSKQQLPVKDTAELIEAVKEEVAEISESVLPDDESIQVLVEGLKYLVETLEGDEKQELQDVIDGLLILEEAL